MRLRRLIVLGAIAWLAGCGGGGEKRVVDAGTDNRPDVAQGDGAHSDGALADAPADHPADAGIEAPGKPIGSSCAMAAECASGFCADGVCCNTACTGTCVTCAASGQRRHLRPRPSVGDRPARRLRRSTAARPAASTGTCDGAGACDKYPAGHGLPGAGLRRVDADVARSAATAPATCVATAGPVLRAVRLRHRRHAASTICASDATAWRRTAAMNGSCGKKPLGAALRRRRRVQLGLLRAGRLLRHRLRRHLPVVRVAEQRRHLHQRARRRRIRWASAPIRARATCGTRRHLRRQGGAAARTPPARSACAPTCTGVTATLPGRCDGTGTCVRRHAAAVRSLRRAARTGTAGPPARPTPTARRATSATGRSAARRSTASTARPAPSARRDRASKASAAPALHGNLHVVRPDRHAGAPAPRSRPAPTRWASAPTPAPPAAAPTARATAPARAGCTRPAVACGMQPARVRR